MSRNTPCRIVGIAGVQFALPQATQQILDLVDRLDCRCRIINGRRQRLDGDVDQQADGILRVLLRRPFERQVDGPHQIAFGQRSFCAMNLKQHRIRDERVADPACQHDDGSCLLCLANQVLDVKLGNRARGGEICQRLDNRTQLSLKSLPSDVRMAIGVLIESLERLADDLATFVAEHAKHVRNLKVAQPLYQARKEQHAEQNQSGDREDGEQRHDPALSRSTRGRAPRE